MAICLEASDVSVLGTNVTLGEVWKWRAGHFRITSSLAWEVAQSPALAARVFVHLAAPDLIGETVAAKQLSQKQSMFCSPGRLTVCMVLKAWGVDFHTSAFEVVCRTLPRAGGWLGNG